DLDQDLARAFQEHAFTSEFAEVIYSRTEGHPLFMTDLLRNLRDRALIAHQDGHWRLTSAMSSIERTLPTSVQSMIERKMDFVSAEDRPLLVAAAVQGWEFDSALLARVLEMSPEHIEERLGVLD